LSGQVESDVGASLGIRRSKMPSKNAKVARSLLVLRAFGLWQSKGMSVAIDRRLCDSGREAELETLGKRLLKRGEVTVTQTVALHNPGA
jgi:hypothetical protein